MPTRINTAAGVEPTKYTVVNRRKVPAKSTRWRARWRTPDGHHRKATFDRKLDAERHLATVTTAKFTGGYVDPAAGRVTFRSYAEEWRARQVHRPSTAAQIETHMRRWVYPTFGDRPLGTIRPSHLQAFVRDLRDKLAPSTVEVVYRWVSAVFKDAVSDRVMASSPCVGIRLPRVERQRVEPLSLEHVEALVEAIPDRYRALVVFGAGTGVRQGEALAVTVDRVDFLRRELKVDRQLVLVPGGAPTFAPPKTTRHTGSFRCRKWSWTRSRGICPSTRPVTTASCSRTTTANPSAGPGSRTCGVLR
jgi:hypothetical protein